MSVERREDGRLKSRAMAEFEELLRFDGDDQPVEPVDDLSRRREIEAMIDRLEALEERGGAGYALVEEEDTAKISSSRKYAVAIAAVAAVAAVAVLGVVSILDRPSPPELPRGAAAPAPAALSAKVLLASGECGYLVDGLLGDADIDQGRSVEIGEGRAVLGLSDGTNVLIAAGTRGRIARSDDSMFELHLDAGEVLVSIEPGRKLPEIVVATDRGSVLATGTVFVVKADGSDAEVEVVRGSVSVARGGARPYSVVAGRASHLAAGEVTPLERRRREQVLETARFLELLGGRERSTFEINSVPDGAVVTLDGLELGTTPLLAAVRPGYRRLTMALEGYAAVTEQIALKRGETISRMFELNRVPGESRGEEADGQRASRTASGDVPPATDKLPTAQELLELAQGLRKGRDWAGAAGTYGKILTRYPRSGEARTARVSLGMIQLKHLKEPGRALDNFDTYLDGSGGAALSQEAAYWRSRALRGLGRTDDEARALEEFVAAYPGSIRVGEARARIDEIRSH